MTRILLCSLLLLSACVVEVPSVVPPLVQEDLTWSADTASGCLAWTETMTSYLDQAALLWAEWGVAIEEGPGANHVRICFLDHDPYEGYVGWATAWQDGHAARIQMLLSDHASTVRYATHEFGHLVLNGTEAQDHLAPSESGIMSSVAVGDVWSPDDEHHLASFGLTH